MKNQKTQNTVVAHDAKSNLRSTLLNISAGIKSIKDKRENRQQAVKRLENKIGFALSSGYMIPSRYDADYVAIANLAFKLASPNLQSLKESEIEEISVLCFEGSVDLKKAKKEGILEITVEEEEFEKIRVNLDFANTLNAQVIRDYLAEAFNITTGELEDEDVKNAWFEARKKFLGDFRTFFMTNLIDEINAARVKGIEAASRRIGYRGVDIDICCVFFFSKV